MLDASLAAPIDLIRTAIRIPRRSGNPDRSRGLAVAGHQRVRPPGNGRTEGHNVLNRRVNLGSLQRRGHPAIKTFIAPVHPLQGGRDQLKPSGVAALRSDPNASVPVAGS